MLEASSDELGVTRTASYELLAFAGPAARIRVTQSEQVRMPDGGVLNVLAGGSNSGEWLLRPAQPFAEGRQKNCATISRWLSGRGELSTELSIAPWN